MPDNFRITVDEWSADGKKLIRYRSRLDSEVIGFRLFDLYVEDDPTVRLRLRNGARILREHEAVPWTPGSSGSNS